MDDRIRYEVEAHFAREARTMPVGVRVRVLTRLEQAGERPDRSRAHRREWLTAAAAVLLAVSVAGALVVIGTSARRQPAGKPPGLPPPPRAAPAVAYDGARGTLVLFGGVANGALLDETWTWDGSAWAMAHPALSPPARQGALATYDEARRVVLLFGGAGPSGAALADTWTWDGREWSRHATAAAPPAGGPASMTYEPETSTVLLYTRPVVKSGGQGSLWSWDGASWTRLAGEPAPGMSGELLWDGRRVLLVGASDPTSTARQTWEWERGAWKLLSPAIALPSLGIAGAAYDRSHGRAVVLLDGTAQTETWTWDGVTWTRLHPAHEPPLGPGGWLLSDQRLGGLLWYSRVQAAGATQTWRWDGRDWTHVSTERGVG